VATIPSLSRTCSRSQANCQAKASVWKLATSFRWEFFIYFYSNLQIYTTILNFIKNKNQPLWATTVRAYRRMPRRPHIQPPWSTVVRSPPMVSWIGGCGPQGTLPSCATTFGHVAAVGHGGRLFPLWLTATSPHIKSDDGRRRPTPATPSFPSAASLR
jgi:hypothetical protein